MSEMTIDVTRTDDGEALFFLRGEVDLSHVETLWTTALNALQPPTDRLVIDVSEVSFLDSSILGTLVRIKRTTDERGMAFALRRPARPVQRLLHLTGLDSEIAVEQ